MKPAPIPDTEEQRLEALYALRILDTPAEERFDRITRLAQRLLNVPIAMVSLIDTDRQWFKSKQGMSAQQLPRSMAVCAYTILDHEALVVSDALKDQRFVHNPLVVNAPHIRSYAGQPLSMQDGSNVGTLCVMDYQPHEYSEADLTLLKDLAAMAEDELKLALLTQYQTELAESNKQLNKVVAQRKDVERSLQRQAHVFENIAESVVLTDLDGVVLDCNPATEQIYGYSRQELLGKSSFPWQKPGKAAIHNQLVLAEIERHNRWSGELRYVHKRGLEGVSETVILPLPDEDGTQIGRIEVSRDITQRKRLDQQLENILSLQQATFESTAEGILVVDLAGKIVASNQVFREMWHIPEAIMASRDDSQVIGVLRNAVKNPNGFVAKVQALYETPETVNYDLLELNDGRVFERYTQPHRLGVVIVGRVWNFRDVTERKKAETQIQSQNASLIRANQELVIARQQADTANKLKSQFLATMSHELRTPLNAVIGYAQLQLAGMAGDMTDEQFEYQERILVNAQHLLKLINEVLDLSKIEAGRTELSQRPFSLRGCLQDALMQTRVLADNKHLPVDLSIDEQLPQTLVGDAARLKQIVINLLSNAIKFTEAGCIKIEAHAQPNSTWKLSVTDTGIGIPPHLQETIFDEFRQVDNGPTRQYGGTGLGLAIVRRLVLMMDGSVRVNSEIGQGSTFTIILPVVQQLQAVPN